MWKQRVCLEKRKAAQHNTMGQLEAGMKVQQAKLPMNKKISLDVVAQH